MRFCRWPSRRLTPWLRRISGACGSWSRWSNPTRSDALHLRDGRSGFANRERRHSSFQNLERRSCTSVESDLLAAAEFALHFLPESERQTLGNSAQVPSLCKRPNFRPTVARSVTFFRKKTGAKFLAECGHETGRDGIARRDACGRITATEHAGSGAARHER